MRVDVLTTLPGMFAGPLDESIVKRARERGLLDARIHDLRVYTTDRHRSTDDAPYGGGPGMVMRPEPIFAAVEAIRGPTTHVIALSAAGDRFDQARARELAGREHLLLICGHYEGIDERVLDHLVDEELSIGDYVLTGGELPAMVVIDAVARLLPGVLGSSESTEEESHSSGLLEYPHYTRPPEFRGWTIPDALLSGNHAGIARWRREQSLLRTLRRRPDLLNRAELSSADRRFLAANGAPELLRPEDDEPPRRRRQRPRDADGPGAPERQLG